MLACLVACGRVNTCDHIQKRRPNVWISPHWCILCKVGEDSVDRLFLYCPFLYLWGVGCSAKLICFGLFQTSTLSCKYIELLSIHLKALGKGEKLKEKEKKGGWEPQADFPRRDISQGIVHFSWIYSGCQFLMSFVMVLSSFWIWTENLRFVSCFEPRYLAVLIVSLLDWESLLLVLSMLFGSLIKCGKSPRTRTIVLKLWEKSSL